MGLLLFPSPASISLFPNATLHFSVPPHAAPTLAEGSITFSVLGSVNLSYAVITCSSSSNTNWFSNGHVAQLESLIFKEKFDRGIGGMLSFS